MKSIKLVICVLFTALIFFSFSNLSQASEYEYFSVLAETMNPIDSTIGFDCNNGYLKTTTDSTLHTSQYIAQLNLTEGSEIISVKCFGFDNDDKDFEFAIFRYRYNGAGEDVFEQVTQLGSSDTSQNDYVELTSPALAPPPGTPGLCIVNNQNYSYGLYLNMPAATSNELYVVRFLVTAKLPESQQTTTRTVVIPLFD